MFEDGSWPAAFLCLLYVCTLLRSGFLNRLNRVGTHVLVVVLVLLKLVQLGEVLLRGVECSQCRWARSKAGISTYRALRVADALCVLASFLCSHEDWRQGRSVHWTATHTHATADST